LKAAGIAVRIKDQQRWPVVSLNMQQDCIHPFSPERNHQGRNDGVGLQRLCAS